MDHVELLLGLPQLVDSPGAAHHLLDAGDLEVGVVKGGIDKERSRRKGPHQLVEVEGHAIGVVLVDLSNPRHVAVAGPAGKIALVIIVKGSEAATGHHRADPLIEHRREDRVVGAQRVPDAADPVGVDLRERVQQVDRPNVVPDRLHRPAGVVLALLPEVVGVVAERRIVGHDRHVAPRGQLVGVVQGGSSAQSGRLVLADPGSLMKAEHGRRLALQIVGHEQVGGHAVAPPIGGTF